MQCYFRIYNTLADHPCPNQSHCSCGKRNFIICAGSWINFSIFHLEIIILCMKNKSYRRLQFYSSTAKNLDICSGAPKREYASTALLRSSTISATSSSSSKALAGTALPSLLQLQACPAPVRGGTGNNVDIFRQINALLENTLDLRGVGSNQGAGQNIGGDFLRRQQLGNLPRPEIRDNEGKSISSR